MALETLDRRTAIEEAFDSAEADAKGEVYTPPVHEEPADEEQPEVKEPVEEENPDEIEAKAQDEKPKEKQRTRGVPLDERVKPKIEEEKPAPDKKTSNLDKAPTSWGVQRNELWNKTPPEVRAMISKREAEIQQGMSQAGRIRQIAEEYHKVITPFENIIRSMNSTPSEAITNVMTTATALIIGTQEQKCAVITEMVQRYGVDLKELDTMLTKAIERGGGKLTHIGGQPAPAPIDPRFKPLFDMEQRLRQAEIDKQQRLQTEAAEHIATVHDEPYYEDVRDDMADIMEISAKRGHIMTIKEAYDKACQIHPEISKLIAPKKQPRSPSDALARARRASSTVKGSPGGPVTNGKMDRRAALEAAWDAS